MLVLTLQRQLSEEHAERRRPSGRLEASLSVSGCGIGWVQNPEVWITKAHQRMPATKPASSTLASTAFGIPLIRGTPFPGIGGPLPDAARALFVGFTVLASPALRYYSWMLVLTRCAFCHSAARAIISYHTSSLLCSCSTTTRGHGLTINARTSPGLCPLVGPSRDLCPCQAPWRSLCQGPWSCPYLGANSRKTSKVSPHLAMYRLHMG